MASSLSPRCLRVTREGGGRSEGDALAEDCRLLSNVHGPLKWRYFETAHVRVHCFMLHVQKSLLATVHGRLHGADFHRLDFPARHERHGVPVAQPRTCHGGDCNGPLAISVDCRIPGRPVPGSAGE